MSKHSSQKTFVYLPDDLKQFVANIQKEHGLENRSQAFRAILRLAQRHIEELKAACLDDSMTEFFKAQLKDND
jgi:metal-responsive CopG/Arc/MetJ family transcriptional regulator